ncbi:YveK family protein [Salsuginibacillus kocurii]|uniref:YveK family protein n=1 Tax=Salsuginibacillus kocurii TaxID=427078 RepID=UPI00036E3C95|nr:Wzz/FepE/Etk N-terminal domain-containing protein [Salsuginibacillus kocurii]
MFQQDEPNYQTNQSPDEISLSEMIEVLWRYKILIIGLPILLAVIAYIASQFMTPSYSASAKLYLGNFGSEMYTDEEAAEQVILSNDFMEEVKTDLGLQEGEMDDLEIETLPSNMIEIEASHQDPEQAESIANYVATNFLSRAEPAYQDRLALMEEQYELTVENYEETAESLDRNREALTSIEENTELSEAERDLSRTRLIDYVENHESEMRTLDQQLQEQQLELKDIHEPEVFDQAQVPNSADSPNPLLNTAIAFVVGGMGAVGLAFSMEFFKNNPIRPKKD